MDLVNEPAEGTTKQSLSEFRLRSRVHQLEEYIQTQVPKFRTIQHQYKDALRRLRESERLNQLHPDTGLPIYRFLLQDLEALTRPAGHDDANGANGGNGANGARSSGMSPAADPETDQDSAPDAVENGRPPRLSEASGCADVFRESPKRQGFTILLVRLDEAYSRIKNSRDRQKALLFKSSYRIRSVLDRGCMYQSDRLDEFYILYPGTLSGQTLTKTMAEIRRAVAEPHDPPAEDIRFGASVSATSFPGQAESVEGILTNLEIAMEDAETLPSKISVYTDEMGRRFRHRRVVESELAKAMQRGFEDFSLVYQPFCSIDGVIKGAEVLIRWQHKNLGAISPALFIPIAEANGSIRLLGRWTLFQACRTLAVWQNAGITSMQLAVNLSPVQFLQKDLVESILNVLRVNKIPAQSLKLEITEGAIMADPDESIQKMESLRESGIRLCIDDFGTGYSSLAYLKKLPVDVLKIDKSFIDDVVKNQSNQEIVRVIINLAKNLRMETLAEGVEYEEQLDFLRAEGTDSIQGYFFSPPVDEATFRGYLETGGTLPLS